jgi:ribosomal protein S18 acetylase RimI-like enzyme
MTSDPAIRRAGPADVQAVRDLVRAAYGKWVALIGREPLPMQADYELAVREHRIDLLILDGELAGLIETIQHADHLWIENVAVAPARQGEGFGRRLLAQAERQAREAGLDAVRLLTNAAFEANIALYKALGYAVERTEPIFDGTAVHMCKRGLTVAG